MPPSSTQRGGIEARQRAAEPRGTSSSSLAQPHQDQGRAGATSGPMTLARQHPPDPFAATPDELQQWANRRTLPAPTPPSPQSGAIEARPPHIDRSVAAQRPAVRRRGTPCDPPAARPSLSTPDISHQVQNQHGPVVISKIDSAAAAKQFEQEKKALLERPFFRKLEAAATRFEVQRTVSD